MAKISQLPQAGTIDGTEQMLGVQGGITKRFSASQLKGIKGDTGQNAYQLAVAGGFTGSVSEWLTSLSGSDGRGIVSIARTSGDGAAGTVDTYTITFTSGTPETFTIRNGANGVDSTVPGPAGASAYQLAVTGGFVGTEAEWLESLHGADGADSTVPGPAGASAYQLAVTGGFVGTEAEWLESLHGADGADSTVPGPAGASAYQLAVAGGFVGTEAEWLESLHGADGTVPEAPEDGKQYARKDGDWVEVLSSTGVVDLTSATTDYLLDIGETATITYTTATSVPLRVATGDGQVYELSISGDTSVSVASSNDVQLNPNNTNYFGAFTHKGMEITTSLTARNTAYAFVGFYAGRLNTCKATISTATKSKMVMAVGNATTTSASYYFNYSISWGDTTTVWSSLGTMVFPFAQSGKIVIRRIA
jgi:hypothetical protein